MDDEWEEARGAPSHCGDDRRDLHKVWPRADDVYYLEHLKPNNPRFTATPQIAVQRVARVNDERREMTNALVVNITVVRHHDHTIRRPQIIVGQRNRTKRLPICLRMRVVKTHLRHKRIVI